MPRLFFLPLGLLILTAAAASQAQPAPASPVTVDAAGHLVYAPLPAGDRVMDFSFAGYGGGGVALPSVPVRANVSPTGKDDAAAIQRAIAEVSALPLIDGFRGAVQLSAGDFSCDVALEIRASGVVLRGSGSGEHGTVLRLIGPPHAAIEAGGGRGAEVPQSGVEITGPHVPAGATQLTVADARRFHPGDGIAVVRPVTSRWVAFMGMDVLERDGKHETWIKGRISALRTVTAVEGHRLSLDVPLPDDIDESEMGTTGYVALFRDEAVPSHIGIESLSIVAPAQHAKITDAVYSGLRLDRIADAWVQDVALFDTIGTVNVSHGARRVTLQNIHIEHTTVTLGAAKPADFSADGTQILIDRCTDKGDGLFYLATGAGVTGPIVLLHCTFEGGGWIQPHQRWATGLLVDSCHVPGGGIDFMNRGQMGSGHGWTIGWAVAWNCTAKTFLIQRPPGSMNWAVGCTGELTSEAMPFGKGPLLPNGIAVSQNSPVLPDSLFLAQLRERLGPGALAAIGY